MTFASSNAGERIDVYELAESGTQIVFLATTGNNPDRKSQPLNETDRKASDLKPDKIEEFELAESGQVISFELNTFKAGPKNDVVSEHREKSHDKTRSRFIEFEMAESGQKIVFEQVPESTISTARGNMQCSGTNATC